MEIEQTLVLIKPDGVQRNLIGKITTRFEDMGLKIVAMKMIWANDDLAKRHYPINEEWSKAVYEKTKTAYEKEGKEMTHKDHTELSKELQSWLVEFLKEGPVVAMVLEGPHAIEIVRKITGSTEPRQAAPGTIRGDFSSLESYAIADKKKRVLRNLIHASDSVENAKNEISVWFNQGELHAYKTLHDKIQK